MGGQEGENRRVSAGDLLMSQYQSLSGYQVLLRRAQEHKDNPTTSEQQLLSALARELPQLNFQFQVVMVPFIVDFVSLDKKVIIEVDGNSHEGKSESDETRQRDLERDGYSFIRFKHEEVISSTSKVIDKIQRFCALSTSQRRRFASPKSEYVPQGSIPRIVGEKNPFAGLHTRRELEIILADEHPYDVWETLEADKPQVENGETSLICTICNMVIGSQESRIRDHRFQVNIRWSHKSCR